jgi:hypothetical protein
VDHEKGNSAAAIQNQQTKSTLPSKIIRKQSEKPKVPEQTLGLAFLSIESQLYCFKKQCQGLTMFNPLTLTLFFKGIHLILSQIFINPGIKLTQAKLLAYSSMSVFCTR